MKFNKKGELSLGAIGSLILLAVALIFGTVLISEGIADQTGTLTSTSNVVNETFTLAALNGFTDRPDCVNFQGTPVLINNSGNSVVIQSGNYSFTTRVSPTLNLKVLTVQTLTNEFDAYSVNASYTCLPQGYAEDSGARSIAPLTILFSALALVAVAIFYGIKNSGFDFG